MKIKRQHVPGMGIIDLVSELWKLSRVFPMLVDMATCFAIFCALLGLIVAGGSPAVKTALATGLFLTSYAILAGTKKFLQKKRDEKIREIQDYRKKFPKDSERVIEALPRLGDLLKTEIGGELS